MKSILWGTLVLLSSQLMAQKPVSMPAESEAIFPKGQKVPSSTFTGTAYVQPLVEADSSLNIPVGNVTFEPGARTYWHSHAGGQIILAIAGVGYYQEQGKPIQILKKGDVVKCPVDVPHWHGASPYMGFIQVAITPNTPRGRVKWLQAVTEEEYTNLKK